MLQLGLPFDLELAVRVERVVRGELKAHVLEVVFRVRPEPEGHRLESCTLRAGMAWRGVRRPHDFRHVEEGHVLEPISLDDRVEAAPFVSVFLVMKELRTRTIVRDRALLLRDIQDLLSRHEEEFGLGIYELADQPRTRDPIDLRLLSGYPLHRHPPEH